MQSCRDKKNQQPQQQKTKNKKKTTPKNKQPKNNQKTKNYLLWFLETELTTHRLFYNKSKTIKYLNYWELSVKAHIRNGCFETKWCKKYF